ncbi:MAG: HAD family phosphatase [Desulfofustis sp.]|nr:HAD family phosphatase [Desulfofustis sp.]
MHSCRNDMERAGMIEALIFDMDGTLVDSEPLHHLAWQQTLADHGVPSFSWEQFLVYVGTSNEKVAEDFIAAASLETDVAELVRRKQVRYLEMIPQLTVLPGVRTVLQRFGERCRLAVASSSHLLELRKILQIHALDRYFEVVVGGDMVARKKPAPDIYQQACRLLDLSPDRCLAFEDSQSGVQAAKSAGLQVVAVPSAYSRAHDFATADLVITRIDQVETALLDGDHFSVRTSLRSSLT